MAFNTQPESFKVETFVSLQDLVLMLTEDVKAGEKVVWMLELASPHSAAPAPLPRHRTAGIGQT